MSSRDVLNTLTTFQPRTLDLGRDFYGGSNQIVISTAISNPMALELRSALTDGMGLGKWALRQTETTSSFYFMDKMESDAVLFQAAYLSRSMLMGYGLTIIENQNEIARFMPQVYMRGAR